MTARARLLASAAVLLAAKAGARPGPGARLFGLGYHLAGGAVAAGIEGRIPLGTDRLRLALGGRMTGAYAVVPVAGGRARVPNVALHPTAGIDGVLLR